MVTTPASYRKPAQSTSGNLALNSPHELVPLVRASTIHPRRRIVLLAMLECNAFAVEGSRNELYPATLTVSVMVGLPYITVRRAIDALEQKDKVLTLVRHENSIGENGELRRPRTYQVVPEKLIPRMTIAEHRKLRYQGQGHRKQSPVVPIDKPSPAKPPSPSAPTPTRKPAESKPFPKRTRRECRKVLERMATLLQPELQKSKDSGFDADSIAAYLLESASKLHKVPSLANLASRLDVLRGETQRGLSLERLESDLTAVEKSMVATLRRETDNDVLAGISREVAQSLASYRRTMNDQQWQHTAAHAAEKLLLEYWKLPRLSLFFMPEKRIEKATPPDRDAAFKAACKYFQFSESSVIEGWKHWEFEVAGYTVETEGEA